MAAAKASVTVTRRLGVFCDASASLSATCRAVGRSSARSGEHLRDQPVERGREIGRAPPAAAVPFR
jgi:hypothetical protein